MASAKIAQISAPVETTVTKEVQFRYVPVLQCNLFAVRAGVNLDRVRKHGEVLLGIVSELSVLNTEDPNDSVAWVIGEMAEQAKACFAAARGRS